MKRNYSIALSKILIPIGLCAFSALALNNGVGRTPPMGFNPYNSIFCLMEYQWRMLGDAMVESGMKAAGYEYVNNDVGQIPNATALTGISDYLHAKGLKMGVYVMPSRDNCTTVSGCQSMATKLKNEGVDYLKFDGWTGTPALAFTAMRDALAATGRPIFYSANIDEGPKDGTICNSWRTSGDIDGEFASWTGCIGTNAGGTGAPGGWGDPDMMTVGCGISNETEEMAQFSLWCVTSSPLLCGSDLRNMFLSTHYILLNTEAIAVNQDTAFSTNSSYGGSGRRIKQSGNQEIWLKTVTGGAKAVVLFNTGTASASITVNWTDIGIAAGTAQVRDLWQHKNLGAFTNSYSAQVPSHGCAFVKIVPGSDPIPEPAATWFPKPADPVPITPLAKTGWTVSGNNLPYPANLDAAKIIDGNLSTYASAFTPGPTTDVWFSIDMKSAQTFNCVIMSGPADSTGPCLKPYKVYCHTNLWILAVSSNGSTWTPVDSTWSGPNDYKAFTFADRTAQYIKATRTLVGFVASTHDDWTGDNFFYGYCGKALGEVYVARTDLSVNNTPDAHLVRRATSGVASAGPRLSVTMGGRPRGALDGAVGGRAYSIDGKILTNTNGLPAVEGRSGIVILDRR